MQWDIEDNLEPEEHIELLNGDTHQFNIGTKRKQR